MDSDGNLSRSRVQEKLCICIVHLCFVAAVRWCYGRRLGWCGGRAGTCVGAVAATNLLFMPGHMCYGIASINRTNCCCPSRLL